MIIENETENLNEETAIVKKQTPSSGITINKGTNIFVEIEP